MFARIALVLALFAPSLAFADDAGSGSAVLVEAGSGSAATPAPAAAQDPTPPKAEDVSVATKLWKNGEWFGLGILVLYVALFAGWKLDKKHAFYWATGLGGLAVLIESIRKGDTPSVTMMMSTMLPTVGIMITGPGHEKKPASP